LIGRSLRVLIVSGSYPPLSCGVGDYTASLCNALSRTGEVQVGVLTSVGAEAGSAGGGPGIEALAPVTSWSLCQVPALVERMRAWNPDLVHLQFPSQGYASQLGPWLLPLALRIAGLRVIQTWHEYVPGPLSMRPLLLALAGNDALVVRPDYEKRLPRIHRRAMRGARITRLPGTSQVPTTKLDEGARQALRAQLVDGAEVLVGFFGFAYPHKRVELLFDCCDPDTTRLLLIGQIDPHDPYQRSLLERTNLAPWTGKVTRTGFLPPDLVADYLAACDVVVLPFADGGGNWNSSLHAARSQGTHVVTTSETRRGYVAAENTTYIAPDDLTALAAAIRQGDHPHIAPAPTGTDWEMAARLHIDAYHRALADRG
jgi:glycosyltransferase involved in cell wall biosynthesis